VKLVVLVKLLPTSEQASALKATLTTCNEAAGWVSSLANEHGVTRNFGLRKLAYAQIRARWGLGAQAAQHVVRKTSDAYATWKANLRAGNLGRPGSTRYHNAAGKPITFRPESAQPYEDRMLSWQIAQRRISIWPLTGAGSRV
jgi:putative transposase